MLVSTGAGEEEERVPGEDEEDEHDGDDDRDDDDDQEEWNLADRAKMVVKSARWMQEVD